jgi:hypothetical protein
MPSRLLAAGILASFLALASPALFSQNQTPPAQPQGQPHARRPLPKPTNLKVLPRDIAPEELVKIMHGYSGALGVECSFCHAPGQGTHRLDFASDAKDEKTTARIMIQMTRAMNEQFMPQIHDPDATAADKSITCGTCHRGHHMPEHFVPPPEHHGPPPGQAPQAQ